MEIKFNENLIMIDGEEIKHENITPNYMMEFIEKVILDHGIGDFKIIGEAINPLQTLVKNVAFGAIDDTFLETIKKLEDSVKSSRETVEEIGEIDYDIMGDVEK